MIKNISLSDPYMYYRLDPGEVGPTLPVRAKESIMHVASHEAANLARMKYDAWSRGGIVVYEHLHLDYTKRGNFIAASSGYSEVRVIYPNRKGNTSSIYPEHCDQDAASPEDKDTLLDPFKNKKALLKYIEDIKVNKEIEEAEEKVDTLLAKVNNIATPNKVKEAIKAYKMMIALAKSFAKSNHGKKLAESMVASIKNKVNLLT